MVTLGLARELKARGHDPRVLAAKRSVPGSGILAGETEDYEVAGIPVRRVGRPEEGFSRPYRLNYENKEMAQRAREFLREFRADIVHVMHLQGLTVSVLSVFEEFGMPVVFTANDFWTVCPVVDLRRHDGDLCTGPEISHCLRCIASRNPSSRLRNAARVVPGAALEAAERLSRTPLSHFAHSLRQVRAVAERPAKIRSGMERVDRFVAYTELTRGLLLANGLGKEKTEVSVYGIEAEGLSVARQMRRPSPTLRVGFVGTIAPHKGPDTLLRAFESLPPEADVSLVMHGGMERYESFVKELLRIADGDRRVSFPGSFTRKEIGRIFAEIDVLVVPSRWYENAPGVILEAFAAGVPVIATNLGGMSELVGHGENGLLFEPEDVTDLARQLRRFLDEPDLLETLRGGIGHVKTIRENVDELEKTYSDVLRLRSRDEKMGDGISGGSAK